MKILLGNNTLSLLAGSETWTETMAIALKKLGHEVSAYSPELGIIAAKMEGKGIKCMKEVGPDNQVKPFNFVLEKGQEKYDVIICNHFEITRTLRKAFPDTPIIATVHGILHKNEQTGEIWPEHPVLEEGVVNQYVAVSEEVQDKLKTDYNIDSVIIRNPIDLERFMPDEGLTVWEKPKTILINTNYFGTNDDITQVIKDVALHYEARLMGIGFNFTPTYEVEGVLKSADIVVGMGRGLLEGMVMGRLAICHGRWGSEGVITPDNYDRIKEQNFSGRGSQGKYMTKEELIEQIDNHYQIETLDKMRDIIAENHGSEVVANKYLELAKKLCE